MRRHPAWFPVHVGHEHVAPGAFTDALDADEARQRPDFEVVMVPRPGSPRPAEAKEE